MVSENGKHYIEQVRDNSSICDSFPLRLALGSFCASPSIEPSQRQMLSTLCLQSGATSLDAGPYMESRLFVVSNCDAN